jgi:hypothetical protein
MHLYISEKVMEKYAGYDEETRTMHAEQAYIDIEGILKKNRK